MTKRPTIGLYYAVKESFWFLPGLMVLVAAGAAVGSVALDRHLDSTWVDGLVLVWSGGAEGARSVLSVIAGSSITVAALVFSITITALAQTSAHYGPRVLRNFTRDRRNQFALGAFLATFLFSLMVLRTVRTAEEDAFVPYVAVNLGLALALLSIGVLIFFIHHIAVSIQADLLIARIGGECREAVERMFPETLGKGVAEAAPQAAVVREPADIVLSRAVGYVEAVDAEALFQAAREAGVLITVVARPGDFINPGQPLARVAPTAVLDDRLEASIRDAFDVGARRTPEQDLAYSVQQLVEVAARALSPGINEPFTALLAIDNLRSVLWCLAGRESPPPLRKDDTGTVRVIAYPLSFPEIVQLSLGMIRRYAGGSSDIYRALLKTVRELAPALRRESDRDALVNEVHQIVHDAASVRNPHDRERVYQSGRETGVVLMAATLLGPPTEEASND